MSGLVIPRVFGWTGPEGSAGTADPSSPDEDGASRDDSGRSRARDLRHLRALAIWLVVSALVAPAARAASEDPALAPGTVSTSPRDGLPYVLVPPGTFEMGCVPGDDCGDDRQDEKPRHPVQLTRADLAGMSAEQIVEAQSAGLLDEIQGIKP